MDFLETHNFPAILDQVKIQPYVTFVGAPGSGKTATARHIALILQNEGYDILPIKEIDKIEHYCNPVIPQVFVIDDVLGVFGLNKHELVMINKYFNTLNKPINPTTKILMTCREGVFRQNMLSHYFLANKENVVNLQNQENALNDDDKQNLLAKYNLEKDLLGPRDLEISSNMFPLLCKLFSSEMGLGDYGPKCFTSPVPCILKQMELLEKRNKYQYASLVLLMANENKLSEKSFDNEKPFAEMKCNILKRCEVLSITDDFQLRNALSEMEGTYTKKSDKDFVFIHDCVYEIFAYHFGLQYPEVILQYASSSYIANYIKVEKDNSKKRKGGVECKEEARGDSKLTENVPESEKITDLRIQLPKSKYPLLAERLFKDVQNEEFDNVFGNKALKNPSVLQNFIAVMKQTTYDNLHNVLLSEKIWNYELGHIKNEKFTSLRMDARRCLVNEKRVDGGFRKTTRGVAWAIFFGHNAILQSFFSQMIQNKGNVDDLFHRDIDGKDKYKEQRETDNNPVILEQCRLLCLACYSGDLNIVQTLLKHVNTDALNKWFRSSVCLYYKNPLIIACKYGYLDIVMKLIEAGTDVNLGFLDETPLTTACENGQHSIVRVLLELGADVNHGDPLYNYTPLQYACKKGSTLLVEELIKAGADVNLSRHGETPLLVASKNGHFSLVKMLISTGVDVNKKSEGTTPLIAACDGGHFNVMKLLMKSGAKVDPNDEDKTTLSFTYYVDHLIIINKLIEMESSFDLNDINKMSFIVECYSGHLSVVKEMIKDGADVNMKDGDKTPLIVACYKNNVHVVKELIEAGADVNLGNDFISPLQVACYVGHLSIVKQLNKVKFDGSQKSSNTKALIGACFFGHLSVVEELIACDIEVNQNHGKETPLTTTCYMGNLNIFKELIKAGADVNLNSGCGTPLTIACYRKHVIIVRELINEKADVNQSDGNKTPLTAACESGHCNAIPELIRAGANVNQGDGNKTPRTAACKLWYDSIIHQLIRAGADVNLSDGNKTPLTAARELGYDYIIQQLIWAGADVNLSDGNKTPLTAA